jgi:DNA adenine methylase
MKPAPFLKWAGGKRQLLPELLSRVPDGIETYFEPFIGGGALFFELCSEARFKRAVIADQNRELVITYRAVKDNVESVIDELIRASERHDKDFYYETRAVDPDTLSIVQRAARLIYLNRTCFNGLYRVNRKGGFNVPMGAYTNPTICDAELLRSCSHALASAEILCGDFQQSTFEVRQGDFVYFDPPYAPVSKSSNFTAFAKEGFKVEDQERLEQWALALDNRGADVLLSNSDCKITRAIYKGWHIESVQARRNINSKSGKRGVVGEILVSPLKEKRRRAA